MFRISKAPQPSRMHECNGWPPLHTYPAINEPLVTNGPEWILPQRKWYKKEEAVAKAAAGPPRYTRTVAARPRNIPSLRYTAFGLRDRFSRGLIHIYMRFRNG